MMQLTRADARKFKAQVTYGRPKAAAVEMVRRGVALSREFVANGGKLRYVPLWPGDPAPVPKPVDPKEKK